MTRVAEGETIAGLRRRISGTLRSRIAGDERGSTADLDARIILGHALGLDATGLIVNAGRPVDEADVARAMALAERRIAGEPVARIVGEKEFWSLPLRLSPETLVPRPDTETLVEAARSAVVRAGRRDEALAVLDLGTGSGAILLALLSELPKAWGLGVDRSLGAARTAAENARRLGFARRACFAVSDWAAAIAGRFDLIVANPPYIATEEIAALPVDVRGYDPDIALNGGVDGLECHRAVLGDLERILAKDGLVLLEIGAGQADAVSGLAASQDWRSVRHKDYAGIERVMELQRGDEARRKNRLGNQSRTS